MTRYIYCEDHRAKGLHDTFVQHSHATITPLVAAIVATQNTFFNDASHKETIIQFGLASLYTVGSDLCKTISDVIYMYIHHHPSVSADAATGATNGTPDADAHNTRK